MKKARIQVLMAVFGFGMYWAWINVFAFSDVLYRGSSDANALNFLGGICFMIGNALAMFAATRVADAFLPLAKHRFVHLLSFFILLVAILFSSFSDARTPAGILVCVTGALCAGVGSALLLLLWGEFLGALGAKRAGMTIASAFIVGIGLYQLILLLPLIGRPLAVIAILGLSLVLAARLVDSPTDAARADCANRARRSSEARGQASFPWKVLPWKLLLGGLVYGMLGSLVRYATSFSDSATFHQGNEAAIVARLAIGLLLLVGLIVFRKGLDRGFTYRPTIPIIALGCLIIPFWGDAGASISAAVAHSGYAYFLLFSLVAYSDIVFRSQQSACKVFGWGRIMDSLGFLIGAAIASLLNGVLEPEHYYLVVSALGILLVTLVPVLILTDGSVVDTDYALPHPREVASLENDEAQSALELRCIRLSKECGLTAKESEVLTYLSQGRSLPFIEKKIFISHNTAKTHVQSIYRKMGVHSRQELLDLVLGEIRF